MGIKYSSDYAGLRNLEVVRLAKRYNSYLLKEILQNIPQSFTQSEAMVDFGAGIGTFSEMARDRGYQVECIEKDAFLRAKLEEKGFTVYVGPFQIPSGSKTYIFGLNVLEHIEDHQRILRELFEILRPGGVLYLYVPAFNILFSAIDKNVGHFRRYNKSNLLPLLKEAGFVIEKAYYVDSVGFFASLFYRYWGNKNGELSPGVVKFYDRFLFPLGLICDHLLRHLFGKNLAVKALRTN